jgi:hypothetical protein
MIPVVWAYWAVSLTIVTYVSAYIVKKHREHGFAALTAFYVIYLGASQIIAARFIDFNVGLYSFYAPAAVFIYPFIAQAIDMVNEAYGFKKTQLAIGIAFTTQILLVLFIFMTNSLAPAPFFNYEDAWQNIFSLSVRITIASWASFLITQNVDAWVFTKLKEKLPKQVLLRSVSSDVADLTLDSLIFVPLAFYGTGMPIMPLLVGQIISKNIIGILDTPWFLWYKRMIG